MNAPNWRRISVGFAIAPLATPLVAVLLIAGYYALHELVGGNWYYTQEWLVMRSLFTFVYGVVISYGLSLILGFPAFMIASELSQSRKWYYWVAMAAGIGSLVGLVGIGILLGPFEEEDGVWENMPVIASVCSVAGALNGFVF